MSKALLLMVQKSGDHHLAYIKPCNSWEIYHINWLAGFPNHQQYFGTLGQWSFLVPLIGGRYHIIPQLAVYTIYILPIGWLYITYRLLREPETAIDWVGKFLFRNSSHITSGARLRTRRGWQNEDASETSNWVFVSNIFYFHPELWGRWTHLDE